MSELCRNKQSVVNANALNESNLNEASAQPLFYYRTELLTSAVEQLQQLNLHDLSRLIINVDIWTQLPESLQKAVAAVHYKQQQVMDLQMGQLPLGVRCIAACHDVVSLQRTHSLGFDAVILSPVLPTATHPDAHTLGWEQFAQYAKSSDLPVFALGGLSPTDLSIAQQYGAYGIAGISQF